MMLMMRAVRSQFGQRSAADAHDAGRTVVALTEARS